MYSYLLTFTFYLGTSVIFSQHVDKSHLAGLKVCVDPAYLSHLIKLTSFFIFSLFGDMTT